MIINQIKKKKQLVFIILKIMKIFLIKKNFKKNLKKKVLGVKKIILINLNIILKQYIKIVINQMLIYFNREKVYHLLI